LGWLGGVGALIEQPHATRSVVQAPTEAVERKFYGLGGRRTQHGNSDPTRLPEFPVNAWEQRPGSFSRIIRHVFLSCITALDNG
jgi:hypothetical protein